MNHYLKENALKISKQLQKLHFQKNYAEELATDTAFQKEKKIMTDKGTTDKIKGKAKEVASDAKDKVEDVVENVKEKLDK